MSKVNTAWHVSDARSRLFARIDRVVQVLGFLSVAFGLVVLLALIIRVSAQGYVRLTPDFFTHFPSRVAEQAGILSAWAGTLWIVCVSVVLSVPLGVMSAIYLEEYAQKNWLTQLLEINIANLAGVPSIIYGLLGLGLFVRGLMWGRVVLAGSATMALLVLPIVILATREALRAVPYSLRESSYALGATKWQTIWHQVLPAGY